MNIVHLNFTAMKELNPTFRKIMIFFLILIAMFGYAVVCNAQTVRLDASGNYVAVKDTATKTGKKLVGDVPTGKFYIDSKGVKWPVYTSPTGRLVIIRTSKESGDQYRQYLKLQ